MLGVVEMARPARRRGAASPRYAIDSVLAAAAGIAVGDLHAPTICNAVRHLRRVAFGTPPQAPQRAQTEGGEYAAMKRAASCPHAYKKVAIAGMARCSPL